MEIRHPIPVEEAEGWTAAMVTTHLGSVSDEQFPDRVERARRNWDPDRTWGATDHGRWVATLWTEPRAMTVPGFDGAVNDIDAALLAANWNPQTASAPEPGAWVLLAGMLLAAALRRRKQYNG